MSYTPPQPHEVDALYQRALELRHLDTRQALALGQQARDLALQIDYQRGLAYSLYACCLCRFILGDLEDVLPQTLQVLELFQSLGDDYGQAQTHNILATMYARQTQYAEANHHDQQSLTLRRNMGDQKGVAGSLNNMGIVFLEMGRYADALEYLWQSYEVAEAQGLHGNMAYALGNTARVHVLLQDYAAAQYSFEKALELNRYTQDRAFDSTVLSLLGELHSRMGHLDQAIECLQQSQLLAQQTGNHHDQAIALLALGKVYGQQQPTQAVTHLQQALQMMQQVGDRYHEAEALIALAEIGLQQQPQQALENLQKALAIAQDIEANPLRNRLQRLLSDTHAALGQPQEALEYLRDYHQLWVQMNSKETLQLIQAKASRSALEQAQREAHAERQKNTELEQALQALQEANEQKARLVRQLENQTQMLEQLAREDGLTGVANRRWLELQLAREFDRSQRFGHEFSVALLDIDNFKAINDRLSHLVGDQVLRQLATLLRDNCRSVDTFGRYGGEEFMLLLIETPLESALAVCQRLCQLVEQFSWSSVHPQLERVTVSIGLSSIVQKQHPQELLATADEQLYVAKRNGKNQVCGTP